MNNSFNNTANSLVTMAMTGSKGSLNNIKSMLIFIG